jgi:hypothetical protein
MSTPENAASVPNKMRKAPLPMTPMSDETQDAYNRKPKMEEAKRELEKNPGGNYSISLGDVPTEDLKALNELLYFMDASYNKSDVESESGLQATKFENDNEIIIAFRGTEFDGLFSDKTDWKDIQADIGVFDINAPGFKSTIDALGAVTGSKTIKFASVVYSVAADKGRAALEQQKLEAEQFAEPIIETARKEGKAIKIIGHSLGGVHAQYVSNKYNEPAVVLNSPGIAADPRMTNGTKIINYSSVEIISRGGQKYGSVVDISENKEHGIKASIKAIESELKKRGIAE